MPGPEGRGSPNLNSVDRGITSREMEDSDLSEVVTLLTQSLDADPAIPKSPELFAWKHHHNPFGRSIALVAESEGRIVGLRALMRWELNTPAGDILRCVRAVDTATHPEFQRRGIFRRLTEEAVEVARSDGVDIVFNTPNPKSGAGYLSMGWQKIGEVRPLVRPSLRLVHPKASRDARDKTGEANHLDQSHPVGAAPDRPRAPRGLRTPRHAPYWDWRFRSHPFARYAEVGDGVDRALVRIANRRGRRELMISEIAGDPRRALAAVSRASRADYAAAWFSPGSQERRSALSRFFVPIPGTGTMTLVARPLHDLGIDLWSMSSWDLSVSDLELL